MPEDFPADVRRFIEERIESLGQLETLLLLRRDPEQDWHANEIAKLLYIPRGVAATFLADLEKRGLAHLSTTSGEKFSYRSIDVETDRLIDRLAAIYQERRVAVIALIYSKPLAKVQTFAEAFRLRKES